MNLEWWHIALALHALGAVASCAYLWRAAYREPNLHGKSVLFWWGVQCLICWEWEAVKAWRNWRTP